MHSRILALIALCLALFMAVPSATGEKAVENRETVDAQIDKFFRASSTVGGSLVIAKDGQIVYRRDYGYLNKTKKIPVTQDTYFITASVTKMISAIGILQLAERGLLDLDMDISAYFGYRIANPNYRKLPITLRQCMTHTTSISQGGGYSSIRRTVHDMLSEEIRRPSNYTKDKPGGRYAYSNFAAGLMGSVMEAVTQKSVNAYMTENVFAPLGIDAAYNAGLLRDPDQVASQYISGKNYRSGAKYAADKYEDFPDPERHYRITVGSVWMRSNDLAKLLIALCGDGSYQGTRLLSPQSVLLMREDQKGRGGVTVQSPYGLCVNRIDNLLKDHMIYGHQGLANGMICNAYFDPETGFVFALITNGCSQVLQDHISVIGRKMFEYTYSLWGEPSEP